MLHDRAQDRVPRGRDVAPERQEQFVVKESPEENRDIPEERISERSRERTVSGSVPHVVEETLEVTSRFHKLEQRTAEQTLAEGSTVS